MDYLKMAYSVGKDGLPTNNEVRMLVEQLPKLCTKVFGDRKLPSVIDVGTGPVVVSPAILSRHFDQVVLSEYAAPSRELLTKWLKGTLTSFDWSPYFKIIAKNEGIDSKTVEERLRLAASKTAVLECNIFEKRATIPDEFGRFDAVSSFGVLLCNAASKAQYKTALQNVLSLIKPGGYFIYDDVLSSDGEQCGHGADHEDDHCGEQEAVEGGGGCGLTITTTEIRQCLKEAKVEILESFGLDDSAGTREYYEFVLIGKVQ